MMKPHFILSIMLLLAVLVSACAPAAATELPAIPFIVTITPKMIIQPTELIALNTATTQPTSAPTNTQQALPSMPSPTALATNPTYTPYVVAPTETLLPKLELPTTQPGPALAAWTGLPTYQGDTDPGLLFHVDYDPQIWAQTEGNFGEIVLAHRQIEYCTISRWAGRGLPMDWKVSHDFRVIGAAAFDVNTVTAQSELKFISYIGGNQQLQTGFQLLFNAQVENCIQDAETVLGTLRAFSGIPTITPGPTP